LKGIKTLQMFISKSLGKFKNSLKPKRLEPHKWVNFKEWKNAEEAREIVNYAIRRFKELNVT